MTVGKSKVVFEGDTLLDLTADTVTPETLLKGATAHNAAGEAITGTLEAGGGAAAESDITFYDYEGTIVESWTLAELANKTALPAYPSHEGLICQGWNWSLADLKATNRKMNVGAMYITDDGKTRIYIHLEEGRTSPMLGCCPNGTVTVDWGDGTTPDTLTGTSINTVKWTPTHNYAAPGDYVIKLTTDAEMGFYGNNTTDQLSGILRHSSESDARNRVYQSSVRKIEIGEGVPRIRSYGFRSCNALTSVTIPSGVASVGNLAFCDCTPLAAITLPASLTDIGASAFSGCYALASIAIPNGVTSIREYSFSGCVFSSFTIPNSVTSIEDSAFEYCAGLSSLTIPNSVTSISTYQLFRSCSALTMATIPAGTTTRIMNGAFGGCYALVSIAIHANVISIEGSAFSNCFALSSIAIPASVTSIGTYAFQNCKGMASLAIPSGVTNIAASAFYQCYGIAFYDFSSHTTVPTLANTNAFTGIAADCEIRVPAALVDEWKAATNWATYADYIVGV